MVQMQVELISKELIRPSSPTPEHLRHYQFSFIDQIQAPIYGAFFLFYSEKSSIIYNLETCNLLKKSLSQALTNFYPIAGRIKNNSYVDCNDEGLLFVEAKANCHLSDVLEEKNPDNNIKLMPVQSDEADVLAAFCQITFFKHGGLVISFAISHKLGDALSQFMFLNSWAAIAKSGNSHTNIPSFGSAALFPSANIPGFKLQFSTKKKIVTKVFEFDVSAIEALIAKYTSVDGGRPSRVEAVVAFIWSRFMATTQAEEDKNSKLYTVIQTVNLRTRMAPPLHKLSFGNLFWFATAEADMEAKDDDSHGIVKRMKDSKKKMSVDHVKKLQNRDEQLILLENLAKVHDIEEVVRFSFSSLCHFPAYETDFGWGKPLWVGLNPLLGANFVVFFDNKEGEGMEAWICLTDEDMAKFEIDSQHVSSATNGNPLPAQSRL